MANTSTPFGLRPVRPGGGGVGGRLGEEYTIANAYNTAIYRGYLVKSTGTGRNIAVSGTTEASVGVFWGCHYTDPNTGEKIWSDKWPASLAATDAKAIVIDDPEQEFLIQVDADSVDEADVGQKCDVNTQAGDDTHKGSITSLDGSLIGSTGQLKILRLAPIPGNVYGAYATVVVKIDEHENRATVTAT